MGISPEVLGAAMRALQQGPRGMIGRNPDSKFYLVPMGSRAPFVDGFKSDEDDGSFSNPDVVYLAGMRRYADKGFSIIAWSPTSGIVAVYNRPAKK